MVEANREDKIPRSLLWGEFINIVEQVHQFIKKITNAMMGFKSLRTAEKTAIGIEAFHMLRKEQVEISPVLSDVE
ncbi:DDE-type integrase/transposase/recombinase [Paenibacillus elgii]|uniref:DDE-type integrase/transposase/recombinase n=1 Tax=Paenibacillus elgii TaxID=189691 RepID=UPI00167AB48C|nr:DDE-type integrase/transposase/recombinase [Paenibacillus elgii]